MPEALARLVALCDGAADPPFRRLVRGAPVAAAEAEARSGGLPAPALPGALILADAWQAAHETAQADPSPLGSWWHAILHRREPDAANALYWYRRTRIAPVAASALGRAVAGVLRAAPVPGYPAPASGDPFDPAPFVEACEAARAGRLEPAAIASLLAIQRLEWDAAMAVALDGAR